MPKSRKQNAKLFNEARSRIYKEGCARIAAAGNDRLQNGLSSEAIAAVNSAVNAGLSDPYGDGDQSPVPPLSTRGFAIVTAQDPLRSGWATGLDLHLCLLGEPSFHHYCYEGDVEGVREEIEQAKVMVEEGDDTAMMRLLEGRFSMLRLTPLHLCCQGARRYGSDVVEGESRYFAIAKMLLENGARPNSRDICGFPPLGNAAAFESTAESVALVPLLVEYGADPNAKTRFGEGLLPPTIMRANVQAFRALVQVGADPNLPDRTGLTPRTMARHSPELLQEILDGQRTAILKAMPCDYCSKKGARKHCGVCKKAYYCDKECQKKDWKRKHREECGKVEQDAGEYVDVVVGTMTTDEVFPGEKAAFLNYATGIASNRTMQMKEMGKAFVVKVSRPLGQTSGMSAKINVKNSDWLLVRADGEGRAVHEKLVRVTKEKGIEGIKIYLAAKWVERKVIGGTEHDVLRIDTSRALPTPKPLW